MAGLRVERDGPILRVTLAKPDRRNAFDAELIAELIRRDLPYYDASISRDFVTGMNQFSRDIGILKGDVPYEGVVATQFSPLWKGV